MELKVCAAMTGLSLIFFKEIIQFFFKKFYLLHRVGFKVFCCLAYLEYGGLPMVGFLGPVGDILPLLLLFCSSLASGHLGLWSLLVQVPISGNDFVGWLFHLWVAISSLIFWPV